MRKKRFHKALIHVIILYCLDDPTYPAVSEKFRAQCSRRQWKQLDEAVSEANTLIYGRIYSSDYFLRKAKNTI